MPNTGMSSASTTRAISSQSAWPENIWVRVRACRVKALHAGVLHPERDPHRITRLIAPPAPGLGGDREVRRADDGADDPIHLVQVPETARASVALHDLLDRAAEVDVDELGPVMLGDEARGLGHGARIGAVDLDADRPLDLLELGALQRGADPPPDRLGRQELGQDDVRAHPPADLAVGRLGDAGHGREDEGKAVRAREGQLHGGKILGGRTGGNGRTHDDSTP